MPANDTPIRANTAGSARYTRFVHATAWLRIVPREQLERGPANQHEAAADLGHLQRLIERHTARCVIEQIEHQWRGHPGQSLRIMHA